MSDKEAERIEEMRYELGKDLAQQGEPLHKGASEEFRHGYMSWRGGSNTTPKKFGKGLDPFYRAWVCVCGRDNRRYHTRCQDCGLNRATAILATENQ